MDRICLAKVVLKVDLPLIFNSAFQKLFKATIGSYAIILSKILHQNSSIITKKVLLLDEILILVVGKINEQS